MGGKKCRRENNGRLMAETERQNGNKHCTLGGTRVLQRDESLIDLFTLNLIISQEKKIMGTALEAITVIENYDGGN